MPNSEIVKDNDNTFVSRKEQVISELKKVQDIKIVELSRKLKMWDSNLRKIIKELKKDKKVETFLKNKSIHIRIIN
jgi:predicted transcriptional regulator